MVLCNLILNEELNNILYINNITPIIIKIQWVFDFEALKIYMVLDFFDNPSFG